jgi:DNA gyrase subunit A
MENLTEKEKGYLFGLFEGDGYKIHDKKSRHYTVEFYLNSVSDKRIISYLISLLNKIGLNPNVYQDKRCDCKRIRVYSKGLFYNIFKKIKLGDKNKEFNVGFISGLIDSEGYVHNKKSYIMIINTNKKILEEIKNFLESINIITNFNKRSPSKKDKLDSYRMYVPISFKRLNHLSIKAGEP